MRIDLHCHTKKVKSGDSARRNVSPSDFAAAIASACVEIAAVTNHNHFDKPQYLALAEACDGIAQVWPGVELDVVGSRERSWWHMIVIASPKMVDQFDLAVKKLVGAAQPDDFKVDFRKVFEAFADMDAVFVSHCHQKKPMATSADIEEMVEAIEDKWRLFYEPRQASTVGIWSNHGWNMLLGSDVQDWEKYPEKELPELRLPVSSFEQFYLLARRDGSTVSTLLGNRGSIEVIAHPHEGVDVPLTLREDVNVLFGQKGTGKTQMVHSMERQLKDMGKKCSCYYGSLKEGAFEELLSTSGIDRDIGLLKRAKCEGEIDCIASWQEADITSLSEYIKWIRTQGNNGKKERFKLSNSESLLPVSPAIFSTASKRWRSAQELSAEYKANGLDEFLDAKERAVFESLLGKIRKGALDLARKRFIDQESVRLANSGLTTLKSEIDAKSDTKSKPSSTGFAAFALGRIELFRSVAAVHEVLLEGEMTEREYLGTLDDKGRLDIVISYRMLCPESKTAEFSKGIKVLSKWKSAMEDVFNSVFKENVAQTVSSFKERTMESGIDSLDDFVGVRKYVSLAGDDKPYNPSSGEKGIMLLERRLNEDATVYLLDEPEMGMSNSYVDAVVRRKVQDLAQSGKMVVMATHNANLAVRTLPYVSVYREHDEGDTYRTYVGNPFIDQLTEIDTGKTLSWSSCSMLALEGGPEAFYDRKSIYEAGSND